MSDSLSLTTMADTNIAAPMFRSIAQLDNDGNFSVELDVPNQPHVVNPTSYSPDGKRMFRLVLSLDGRTVYSEEHVEGNLTVEFSYKFSSPAVLTGHIDGADGSSVEVDGGTVKFVSKGYVVDFESCDGATMRDCVIEGVAGGVLVRGTSESDVSSLQLLDCEIILDIPYDPDEKFYVNDEEYASVLVQNLKPTQRLGVVEVTKRVITDVDSDRYIAFDLAMRIGGDEQLNGMYGDLTFVDGRADFTLIHGQTKSASGLPLNVTYEIWETSDSRFRETSENATGFVSRTATRARFINTRKRG